MNEPEETLRELEIRQVRVETKLDHVINQLQALQNTNTWLVRAFIGTAITAFAAFMFSGGLVNVDLP
jgi:hypothetical protein